MCGGVTLREKRRCFYNSYVFHKGKIPICRRTLFTARQVFRTLLIHSRRALIELQGHFHLSFEHLLL